MLNSAEIQMRAGSKLGVDSSRILNVWILEAKRELQLPLPAGMDGGWGNGEAPRCPTRFKAIIKAVIQDE
jgi:hypothetical protein